MTTLAGAGVAACGSQSFTDGGSSSGDGGQADAAANDANGGDSASSDAQPPLDGATAEDSGAPPGTTVLADAQENPNELVLSAGVLYWTNYSETPGTGSVMKLGPDGSAALTKLADARHANRLAVKNGNVYWTDFASTNVNDSAFNATPIGGGSTVMLIDSVAPMGVAAGDSLYVASVYGIPTSGIVSVVSYDGGYVGNAVTSLDNPSAVVADESGLAGYITGAAPNGVLTLLDGDGGLRGTVAGPGRGWGLFLDDVNVYYTFIGSLTSTTGGQIGFVERSSGIPHVIDNPSTRPYFVTAAGTRVYWTEEGIGTKAGSIRWASLADLVPHTFGEGLDRPHGIAVDGTFVYWTEYGSGRVLRAPLP